ncbi:MAG: O-antigen ligase family protein [Desulfobacteraceae bacterium]|nr:O-antigen ligase family protein [Desulfobacteraceae bacterium]
MDPKQLLELVLIVLMLIAGVILPRGVLPRLCVLIVPFSLRTGFGYLNVYIVLAVSILYLVRSKLSGRKISVSFGTAAILAGIVLMYCLSYVFNPASPLRPGVIVRISPDLQAVITILSNVALFAMLATEIREKSDILSLLRLFIVAYVLSSMSSILQLINPNQLWIFEHISHVDPEAFHEDRQGLRISGTLGEYELYAEYSAIVAVMIFYLIVNRTGFKSTALMGLAGYVIFLMFFTKTRGAVLSLSIAFAFIVVSTYKYKIDRSRISKILAVGVTLVVLFGVYRCTNPGYNVIDHLLKTEYDVKSKEFDRYGTWAYGWQELLKGDALAFGRSPGLQSQTRKLIIYPHNLYLFIPLAIGIPGLILFLLLFLRLIVTRVSYEDRELSSLMLFLKAILLLFLVDQLKIEFPRNPVYEHIVWCVFAFIYSVNSRGLIAETMPAAPQPRTVRPLHANA